MNKWIWDDYPAQICWHLSHWVSIQIPQIPKCSCWLIPLPQVTSQKFISSSPKQESDFFSSLSPTSQFFAIYTCVTLHLLCRTEVPEPSFYRPCSTHFIDISIGQSCKLTCSMMAFLCHNVLRSHLLLCHTFSYPLFFSFSIFAPLNSLFTFMPFFPVDSTYERKHTWCHDLNEKWSL